MMSEERTSTGLLRYWAERMDESDMLPDPKWMAEVFVWLAEEIDGMREELRALKNIADGK